MSSSRAKGLTYSFLLESESTPQGHSAAERIISVKYTSDNIENRTHVLLVCRVVSRPTAPPRGRMIHTYDCEIHVEMY